MYTVGSLGIFFDRRPQFAHLRSAVIEAAMQKADANGCIMAGDDWTWMDAFLLADFRQECENDPLGMFGADMKRLAHLEVVIPYLKLVASNFPNASAGEVVLEGKVGYQFGGIPGQYNWDVEIIMPNEYSPTIYWHESLLRGHTGRVQIVLVVNQQGLRSLQVRPVPA